MIRNIAFALGMGLLPVAAIAQDAASPEATYEAARNQLGILQYCAAQGFSGAEAVEAQGALVELLPEGDTAVGDAAEAKGAEGTVSVAGTEIGLAEAVEARGTTVEETCQQIEAAVNAVADTQPAG